MSTGGPRLIRAAYTSETITVYQAYAPQIAGPAVRDGTFTTGFGRDRTTWIKPSFGWMMHRSGWGRKPGQERVLAIEISRGGWEWALGHSCLSHFAPGVYDSRDAWSVAKTSSPVRVQWDPDRALTGEPLPRRAIQVGLSGPAVERYVDEWIVSIRDVTALAHQVEELVRSGQAELAGTGVPAERVYPVATALARRIGADQTDPAHPVDRDAELEGTT
jgi:hypothetical protein